MPEALAKSLFSVRGLLMILTLTGLKHIKKVK